MRLSLFFLNFFFDKEKVSYEYQEQGEREER